MLKFINALFFSLITFFIFSSNETFAWGQHGHRIIGQVAEQHLTESTISAVKTILEGQSLAQVSTWADEMRSNPSSFWKKQSGKWHYINITHVNKLQQFVDTSIDSKHKVDHILDGIYYAINTLKNKNSTLNEKQFALKFLVHLVGDGHQPLHAGNSEDRGGNLISVSFFKNATNLHRTWDTHLIENENLSFTEFADFIKTSNTNIIKEYLNSQPSDWLAESSKIASVIYNEEQYELSYAYVYKFMPIVKERLLQGGIRLAGLLNQIFDSNAIPLTQALIKRG